jgi:hypothetical protein
MQNQLPKQVAVPTAAYSLAVLRARLTALTFSSSCLSESEQLLANHRIHKDEDARQLVCWRTTTPPALARCPRACSPLPVSLAGHVV